MQAGVILAGGYSTRFGDRDKALAELGDTPMVRHVADRLASAVDSLVVNGRYEQLDALSEAMAGYPHPVAYAPDEETGRGPVGGIAAGLAAVGPGVDRAMVVACDMPYLDPALVQALFERADDRPEPAVVPRTEDGWYQVLHAVYTPSPMVDACRRALIDGDSKILEPLSHLEVAVVEAAALPGLERSSSNVNTQAEFDRAAAELADSR